MKKVLICMLQLHKNSGSARTALENVRYYLSRGYEVHVASMTMDKTYIQSQGAIPHKLLPWIKSTGMWRRCWYNYQIQKLRRKLKPSLTIGHGDIQDQDILHLHNCVFYASELINGKPLSPTSEMAQIHGPLLRNQGFTHMIANSRLMKDDSVKRFGIPENKIHVIYPALDAQTFHPVPDKKGELRKRFKFPNRVIVSLVTSGNFKKRGLDIFNEAIKSLPQNIKDQASFRVLGKDDVGEYKNSLLTFDPGLEDIQNYYNAIDVFVLPARIEEFGRVVLEAMGCGLPVITTDKVGASELFIDESKEFILPAGDVKALTKALEKMIVDHNLRMKLGQLNYTAAQNETEEKLYPKIDKIFDSNPF